MSDPSFEGTYESMYKQGATDGLPIVPPTDSRVDEMLEGTDKPPDERLVTFGEREGILTVENLAVNAVMAGCLPIHMPVLIAGVKAAATPGTNIDHSMVSTGGFALTWVMNGPLRRVLDVNSKSGAWGQTYRSNMTMARALGLAYKNTALIYPGDNDMDTVGNPFRFSMFGGENEEESPWEPYHVSRGFDEEDSTVTLFIVSNFMHLTPDDMSPQTILNDMCNKPPGRYSSFDIESYHHETVFTVPPMTAHDLNDAGLSKDDILDYIYENAYTRTTGGMSVSIQSYVEDEYHGDLVPEIKPQYYERDQLHLVVLGGGGRLISLPGPSNGDVVTEKIELPSNWDELVAEYTPRLKRDWGIQWNAPSPYAQSL